MSFALFILLYSVKHNMLWSLIKQYTIFLSELEGLKLHFPVKHSKTGEYENLPTDVFLRKTSFYANKVIITFPFSPIEIFPKKQRIVPSDLPSASVIFGKYETIRKGVSAEIIPKGKLYYLKKDEFDIFIDLISSCRDLISFGSVNILPSINVTGTKSWTFLQDQYGLINANFEFEDLKKQFFETHINKNGINRNLVMPTIYLPRFTNIPENNIIEVRKTENDLYSKFQYEIAQTLYSLNQIECEKELLNRLVQIHGGVLSLNEKYDAMLSHLQRNNIIALMGFTAVGLTFLLPPEIQSSVHKIIGSLTSLQWIKSRNDYKFQKKGLRSEDCFLMWKVANFKKNI